MNADMGQPGGRYILAGVVSRRQPDYATGLRGIDALSPEGDTLVTLDVSPSGLA